MDLVLLCDFDGTITMVDTAELILSKFAEGEWRTFDRQFENGELTLEDCLNKEFSLVRVSKQNIIDELKNIEFRPGFEQLVRYCRENHIPFVIVSAGLDFVVEHFLKLNRWKQLVATFMGKTEITPNGIKFTFPERYDKTSANFKQDFVRQWKSRGKKVIFIGDGSGDYDAAREADIAFAIKGSKLAELCTKHEIYCRSITDFQGVIETLRRT